MSSIYPFVSVTLDKERHLCFGAAAFIEFKEQTPHGDLLKFMKELAQKFADVGKTQEFPIAEFRDVLWAALIHEDPLLTRREVSNMFTLHTLKDLLPLVMEAFALGMPGARTDNANPQKAPVKRQKKLTGA